MKVGSFSRVELLMSLLLLLLLPPPPSAPPYFKDCNVFTMTFLHSFWASKSWFSCVVMSMSIQFRCQVFQFSCNHKRYLSVRQQCFTLVVFSGSLFVETATIKSAVLSDNLSQSILSAIFFPAQNSLLHLINLWLAINWYRWCSH